jgi:hypothetical protein
LAIRLGARPDAVRGLLAIWHRRPSVAHSQPWPIPWSTLRPAAAPRTLRQYRLAHLTVSRPIAALATAAFVLGLCVSAQATTFVVKNTADAGIGSLRDAITKANTDPAPVITFAIAVSGVPTITLATALPAITTPVVIDGTTQQPAGKVEISGAWLADGGLLVTAGNSILRGLVVNRFVSYGIELNGGTGTSLAGGSTVTDCIVGPNATGTVDVATVEGHSAIATGIWVNNSPNNVIGTPGSGTGNLVSGNVIGIKIIGTGSTGNVVQNNVIGLGADGAVLGNTDAGVRMMGGATLNLIGGTSATVRNIVSGNRSVVGGNPTGVGVRLDDDSTQSNRVQGNYIGTDATGTIARPNATGILIHTANRNTIGGPVSSRGGNLVSGNTGVGIDILDVNDGGNKISGNRIGLAAAGDAALPNASGVRVRQCTAPNHIGGAGAGNLISGNTGNGVRVSDLSSGQVIQANQIGVAADGNAPLGNGVNGVYIDSSNGTLVGGDVPNTIAFNGRSGVVVVKTAVQNTIAGNQILGNVDRGIDLGDNGLTPNDARDNDSGPNGLQNFPDLVPLISIGATAVGGTLNSTASTQFTVEVFSNASCPDGAGQGELSIGLMEVTTDAEGNATFSVPLKSPLAAGRILTATATAPDGSTSEFSACTAPAGATTTSTTTTLTPTTRPKHTTTTTGTGCGVTTTTTSVGIQMRPSTTLPGGKGPCAVAASFVSLECRVDELALTIVSQAGLGRRTLKIQRHLERAGKAIRNADATCAQGRLRPTRAALRRASRMVSSARSMLLPQGPGSTETSHLADDAGTIRDDLRNLRLQAHCP